MFYRMRFADPSKVHDGLTWTLFSGCPRNLWIKSCMIWVLYPEAPITPCYQAICPKNRQTFCLVMERSFRRCWNTLRSKMAFVLITCGKRKSKRVDILFIQGILLYRGSQFSTLCETSCYFTHSHEAPPRSYVAPSRGGVFKSSLREGEGGSAVQFPLQQWHRGSRPAFRCAP